MLVLLGPSGCGKTTLLRSLAGLEDPDSGEIVIDGRVVYSAEQRIDMPPEKRGVSFVFQSYALWPHMTVMSNVMYPVRASKIGRREARARAQEALELVGCGLLGARYPAELSGGQQQRVALARAIVAQQSLVFFDEPLSNIDAKVREKLRFELLNVRDAVGFAGVYVTHDQDEAMILGDRIAVMNGGRILQVGAPREVYDRPASRWIADFIGVANFIDGEVVGVSGGEVEIRAPWCTVIAGRATASLSVGDRVAAFFRPEWARLVQDGMPEGNYWNCTVLHTIYVGDRTEVILEAEGHRFVVVSPTAHTPGDEVCLQVARTETIALPIDQSDTAPSGN